MTGPDPKVPAGHGWQWFATAVATVRRWPGAFLAMGLVVGLISLVPLLGGLILLITGPALLAGSVVAADAAHHGRQPALRQLFAMFEQARQRNEALKLCIPLVIGKVVAATVLATAMASAMQHAGLDVTALEGHPEKILALLAGPGMRVWLALALAIVLFAWSFTALAIPRVALRNEPAFAAMGEGFRHVWRNLGAWILAAVVLFAALVVLALLLMLTRVPVIMQLGVYTALYAVLGPLLHAAWQDLGGAGQPPATARGPKPPSPPPPPGFLEA